MFYDDPDMLRAAADYIEEEPTEPIERTPLGVEVGFPTEHPPDFDPPRHLGF